MPCLLVSNLLNNMLVSGTGYVLGTIAVDCTLGVCAAIPVYWLGLSSSRANAPTSHSG